MITSQHNAQLQLLRKLRRTRERRETGLFAAEGEDLLQAATEHGWEPEVRLVAGEDVEPALLDQASGLGSGTRAAAIYRQRWADRPLGPVCLALWGVSDPGNVGTALRSAAAFGASSVALGPGCADPFGPKAVRASMGAIFAVPLARVDDVAALPGRTVALVAHRGRPLGENHGTGTAFSLVVGAEREGMPPDVIGACDEVAHIPIATESLNAAMAATVALYEATRIGRG